MTSADQSTTRSTALLDLMEPIDEALPRVVGCSALSGE
jgi:hypothetical protein